LLLLPAPLPTLFPYTTLFRSVEQFADRRPAHLRVRGGGDERVQREVAPGQDRPERHRLGSGNAIAAGYRRQVAVSSRRRGSAVRSEEHTSELQSREKLVCRLL